MSEISQLVMTYRENWLSHVTETNELARKMRLVTNEQGATAFLNQLFHQDRQQLYLVQLQMTDIWGYDEQSEKYNVPEIQKNYAGSSVDSTLFLLDYEYTLVVYPLLALIIALRAGEQFNRPPTKILKHYASLYVHWMRNLPILTYNLAVRHKQYARSIAEITAVLTLYEQAPPSEDEVMAFYSAIESLVDGHTTFPAFQKLRIGNKSRTLIEVWDSIVLKRVKMYQSGNQFLDGTNHGWRETQPLHDLATAHDTAPSPLEDLIARERVDELVTRLKEKASPQEQEYINLQLLHLDASPMEIGEMMGKTAQDVRNLKRRLRKKN